MIRINKTYTVVTPESAENGDTADAGLIFADEKYTFGQLVDEIRRDGYAYVSCSPATGETYEWITTEPDQNYRDGSWTDYSLHYSHSNPPAKAKYWRKALCAAGLIGR